MFSDRVHLDTRRALSIHEPIRLVCLIVFSLLVSCGGSGGSGSKQVGGANALPTVTTSADQAASTGDIITLTGSGLDTDGIIVGYQWVQLGGTPIVLSNADTSDATFLAPNVNDTLVFELQATDNAGAVARASTRVELSARMVDGVVELPIALPVPLDSLSVASGFSDAAISTDGRFTMSVAGPGPNFVAVLDDADRPLLFGFVDSSGGSAQDVSNRMSAESTAAALLYMALEVWLLQDQKKAAVLDLIANHVATATLAGQISARLVADPALLTREPMPLKAEIESAVVAIKGSVQASQNNQGSSLQIEFRSPAISNTDILASPSNAQSGVIVGPNTAGAGLQVTNQKRRNAWYYVYKTGYEDFDGKRFDVTPPELIAEGFIGGTSGLTSTVQTLSDWIQGNINFNDVKLASPVSLDVADTEAKTFFEVAVPGANLPVIKDHPAWFDSTDARHVEWADMSNKMFAVSFVKDVLFPLIFGFVGPANSVGGNLQGGFKDLDGMLKLHADIINAIPSVSPQLANGEFLAAAIAVVKAFPNNPELRASLITTVTNFARDNSTLDADKALVFLKKANVATVIVDTGIAGLDLLWVGSDMSDANTIDRWDVTAKPKSIILTAKPETLTVAEPDTRITGRVPGKAANEPFCWRWTLSGQGELSSFAGTSASGDGARIITDVPEIQYLVDPTMIKTGELGVIESEAFKPVNACVIIPASESQGSNSIVVNGKVDDPTITLLPATGSMRTQSRLQLSTTVEGVDKNAQLVYRYSLSGAFDANLVGTPTTGITVEQASPAIILASALQTGKATVKVEVLRVFPSERALVGVASAVIDIRDGESFCQDGTDDDNDRYTDCEDRDCANDPACFIQSRFLQKSGTYASSLGMRYFATQGFVIKPKPENLNRFIYVCADIKLDIAGSSAAGYSMRIANTQDCTSNPDQCLGMDDDEAYIEIGGKYGIVDNCNSSDAVDDICNEADALSFLGATYGAATISDVFVSASNSSAACDAQALTQSSGISSDSSVAATDFRQ